jgi:hypothetical protein
MEHLFFIVVFVQQMKRISTDHKLRWPIQFHFFLVLMDPTDGIFERKLKNTETGNRGRNHSQQEMQQANSYLYGFYCCASDLGNV